MPWTYTITTGELSLDGLGYGTGYSGLQQCKDKPADANIPLFGPIPPGSYTIGPAFNNTPLGDLAMPLIPDPTNVMFSRTGLWIHGDSIAHPGAASHGCIVLPRPARLALAVSTDRLLTVTP